MLRRFALASVLLGLPALTGIRAQTSRGDPVDLQARAGVSLNLDLPKHVTSSLGYEARMVNDASVYRGSYFSGDLAYGMGKHLSVFTNYRLARDAAGMRHRFGGGAEIDGKMRKAVLSFRSMLQYQQQADSNDDQASKEVLRTRLRVKVPTTKHLSIYGSVEPYFTFSGAYPVDNWRNTVGMQYAISKRRKIDLHYIYRPDYAKLYNRTFHIIGAEFSYDMTLAR